MLSQYVERRIERLLELHRAHDSLPVPIRQIARDDGWIVKFHERIQPLYGFAMLRCHVKLMGVSADICPEWQRVVIAHEMGHEIAKHPGSLQMLGEWPWLGGKHEREAQLIGARLLIPDWALSEYGTEREIVAACEVTHSLLNLRLGKV